MTEAARSRRDDPRHAPQLPERGEDASDPLAELARLVGRDDPFRDVFRSGRGRDAEAPSRADPHPGAAWDGAGPALDPHAGWHGADASPGADPGHVHSHDPHGHDPYAGHGQAYDEDVHAYDEEAYLAAERAYAAEEAAHRDDAGLAGEPFETGYPGAALPDGWAAGAAPEVEPGPAPAGALKPASARRPLLVLTAVLALTGGGLAMSFLAKGAGAPGAPGAQAAGGAPVIMAAAGPTKVKVDDPAATAPEDKDAALLNRGAAAPGGPVKIVASEEQPADLSQLPKSDLAEGARPIPPAAPSPFPEPKKVKTFVVHPDGTMLSADGAAPAPAAADPVPSTPRAAVRPSATPKAAPAAPSPAPAAPAPATIASLSADPPPAAAHPQPAARAPGGFGLQLASSPVEADADALFAKLKKKYPAQLGGLTATVHKAETGDRPVYRVRVGGMSQEEATTLCGQLRGAGGTCLVVRN